MRHGLAEMLERGIHLPLLPADPIGSEHEVIRRVPDADRPSVFGLVDQLDRRRLIVELEHLLVMFVLVHPRQFDAVALRLDRDPHLAAWVAHSYVARHAAHAPRRWRRTNGLDDRSGLTR